MKITDSFRRRIYTAFCDKTIEHYQRQEITDDDGDTYTEKGEKVGEYEVNAQIIRDAVIAEEYGLTIGRDIRITSPYQLPIDREDYILYGDDWYNVVGISRYDSHDEFICKKVNA